MGRGGGEVGRRSGVRWGRGEVEWRNFSRGVFRIIGGPCRTMEGGVRWGRGGVRWEGGVVGGGGGVRWERGVVVGE